jgi:hypothetical protein
MNDMYYKNILYMNDMYYKSILYMNYMYYKTSCDFMWNSAAASSRGAIFLAFK